MEDLHTSKKSHMSAPITKDVEFHLNKKDYPKLDCQPKEHYMIVIPMVCTSVEGDSYRYKQEGKIEVKDADWNKMPLNEMKEKIGTKDEY